MTRVTIVHGPQGCGKTHNRDRIAKRLGCDFAADAEEVSVAELKQRRVKHALLLTYDVEDAKRRFPDARRVGYASLGLPMWNRGQ